jgi:hypothetical protein
MAMFADAWREAHMVRVFQGMDARECFARLIKGGFIGDKTMDTDELLDRLLTAWKCEPGDSYQAINRAITRAAQTYSYDDMDTLEAQAGELLFNRVQVCYDMGWRITA